MTTHAKITGRSGSMMGHGLHAVRASRRGLLDVFRAYPETARPLLDYHQALLRGPSLLAVAERELIAAYISGLNARGYCPLRASGHRAGVRK